MKTIRQYFYRLKYRERVLVIVAIILLAGTLLRTVVIVPSMSAYTMNRDRLTAKIQLLKKSRAILRERERLKNAERAAAPILKTIKSRLVEATTEALGAAALQKQLKQLADANHLTITRIASFSSLPLGADIGLFILPVEFDVRANTLGAFAAFLYEAEYGNNLFFFVDNLEIVPLASGRGIRVNIKGHALSRLLDTKVRS